MVIPNLSRTITLAGLLAVLLNCSSAYYEEKMVGTWVGSGCFSPISYEYSSLEMKFTADSLSWRATRALDTVVVYGLGKYSMTRTQYDWSIMDSDSSYSPIPGSWREMTDNYEYKHGVFTNDWGLELRRK